MSSPFQIKRPELGGQPSASEVKICAGPLRMIFDHGDLRYIMFRDREIIRRIYAAVRDRNWGTVPGAMRDLKVDSGRDFFHISYDSEHTRDDISFVWHAEISGDATGTISFTFDGEARTTFLKNRIGLCVLHPTNLAGEQCLLLRADGSKLEAEFPKLVAQEQPVRDLFDLKLLSYKIGPDAWLEIEFEGDLFETEDQRNWIDDSYKTYSTPLHLHYPVEIQRGTRIQQSVTLKLGGIFRDEPIAVFEDQQSIEIKLDFSRPRSLPEIGFGVSSFGERYSERAIQRLTALKPGHLRLDLNLSALSASLENALWSPNAHGALKQAFWEAEVLNAPLEIALTVPRDEVGNLQRKHEWEWIQKKAHENLARIKRWLILSDGVKSTTPESFNAAKLALNGFGPIGVGTASDFYQLNQHRPPFERAFFISWSMNPQVHAFDDISLAETPTAIAAQIESARAYFPGKPLHVSPITLKPRFNPVAITPDVSKNKDELPPNVDQRQCSLFGAAWTIAALQNLAQSRANSITFYETVGWRGVLERDIGAPLPNKFPSVPGGVYPLYYIFRWINEWRDTRVVSTCVSRPNEIAALCLYSEGNYRLILGNLTAHKRTINLRQFPKPKGTIRSGPLTDEWFSKAMSDPEAFLRYRSTIGVQSIPFIHLAAHEILYIDFINTVPKQR